MFQDTGTLRASDGVQLFTQQWVPGAPQAALILAHGYAEHSERYAQFARFLAEHGVAVYALDQRGHGRSGGERANIRVFRQYVHDLSRFIETVREKQPQLPRLLFGHSMGGVVASQLVLEHPHQVEGLVLSSAYLKNALKVPSLLLGVSRLLSRYLPGVSTLKLDADLLSRDAAVVAAYDADPLVYSGGTKARLGHELLEAGGYVLRRAESVKLPLLVLCGTSDGVADPAGSRELFERVGSEDKTLKAYEGFYHELLNEPAKERVYRDVLEWVLSQLPNTFEA